MVLAEKRVPGWGYMDPRLRAAMLDTAYNTGRQYFTRSPRMTRRLAAGEDPAVVIAEENLTWVKAGGVKVKGLVIRRQRVKTLLIDWYVRDRDKKKTPALRPG
jgi:GH24 family phage-related lysozyme (muramidase)